MSKYRTPLPRYLPSVVAIAIVAVFYYLALPPTLSDSQAADLASRFQFQKLPLPKLGKEQDANAIREVNPSLQHLAAWISFVGAAVSMGDLDGDGLPNDIAYVDPRFDQIIVCPAPVSSALGTNRYPAFELTQTALPFAASSTAPMGTLFGDFNEDGRPDILAYFWGRSPIIYLRKEVAEPSDASSLALDQFTPIELVDSGEVWHTSCVTQADLDGDGHTDLIIGNYNPDGAATLDAKAQGSEAMMGSWARAFNGGRNRFLLWTGNESSGKYFRETHGVIPHDVACGWTFAIGAADLDDDLLPEIYFVQDFGPDALLHNRSTPGQLVFELLRGQRGFMTPRSKILGLDTFNGMGIDFGDLNRDGRLDIMVSNITSDYGLHQSNFAFIRSENKNAMRLGIAPFRDESETMGLSRSGWSWDCKLGDFDNDGVLEVLLATGWLQGKTNRWPEVHELALGNEEIAKLPIVYPRLGVDDDVAGHERNPFFVYHEQDNRYYDVSEHLAASGLADTSLGRGIAMADVDGDGNLDFARASQWDDSFFFKNSVTKHGAFLGLHLRLPVEGGNADGVTIVRGHPDRTTPPSLPAIGATVEVSLDGSRKLVGQVDGGNGHSGHRPPDLHFGLGSHTESVRVTLRWRGRDGNPHSRSVDLDPGWHTVMMGMVGKPASDAWARDGRK